tara:strand:+ start:129 stop:248 length:120 start_codon:yes stop_codon:yes gene_type:complete
MHGHSDPVIHLVAEEEDIQKEENQEEKRRNIHAKEASNN